MMNLLNRFFENRANSELVLLSRNGLARIATLCLLIVAFEATALQAQTLGWKFAKGDVFNVAITQTSSVQTVVDRRVVEQSNSMTMQIEWVVDEMKDDQALIRQTIKQVVVAMTVPGKQGPLSIDYDSTSKKFKGDARRLDKSFKTIIDKPVTLIMTAKGEVLDVDVPSETMESLRQMPGSMQGRRMFELESVKEMFAQAGLQLPDDGAGNSWEAIREFSIGTPQKFNQKIEYKIADDSGKPIRIDFTGTLTAVEHVGDFERPEGIEFDELEIQDQSSSGKIFFDVEAGNCTGSESTTMLKTKTAYRDMAVVATINSTLKMNIDRK